MREKIKKKQLENGIIPSTGLDLSLDTTNFNDNLDNTVTDIQKLADKVDDLNTVHTYETLPPEIESQIAYNQGKMYYGDGSEWKELGSKLPDGTVNGDGCTLRWDNNIKKWITTPNIRVSNGITHIETTINDYPLWVTCNSTWGAIAITVPNDATNNIIHCMTGGGDNIFKIKYNGQIISNSLSGTTSSLIEALPDGTIQRSSQTIPAAQIQSDWNQTNNAQVDYIKNKPTIPAGETVNIETLIADKTLTANDANIQILNSSIDRIVNLPTSGNLTNKKFVIINNNSDSSNKSLVIRVGTNTVASILTGCKIEFYYNNTTAQWNVDIHNTVSIGRDNISYSNGISIGNLTSSNTYGIAIGYTVEAVGGGVSISSGAKSNSNGIAIGSSSTGLYYGIAIGLNASATNTNCIALGRLAGNGQSTANRLYVHSSMATVGVNSLIYGEFDNRIVRINNTLYVNDLVGTGDRPIVADSTGKLKIGTTPTIPTKIEHTSIALSGTEYSVSQTTLGITGDLRERIKSMQVWIKNSSGDDLRRDSTLSEYISTDTISIESGTEFAGNYIKIILYII